MSEEKVAKITQEFVAMGAGSKQVESLQIDDTLLELEPEDIPEFMLMNTDSPVPHGEEEAAHVSATEYELKLWHHRLCHLGETNMRKMKQKNMIRILSHILVFLSINF